MNNIPCDEATVSVRGQNVTISTWEGELTVTPKLALALARALPEAASHVPHIEYPKFYLPNFKGRIQ